MRYLTEEEKELAKKQLEYGIELAKKIASSRGYVVHKRIADNERH